MENLLDKVTFVITVRERCRHLKRALDYYSRFPVQLVVMDSSDRPCPIDPNFERCQHLHIPQTFIVDALTQALERVKTPYCVITADDDFTIPNAVAEMVRFLDGHPDNQCAQGLYGRFRNAGDVELLEAYPHMPGYAVGAETPQERVVEHLGHYVTHYYAVHRTPRLREAIAGGGSVTNLSANEFITGALNAMAGKFKVLPSLFCVRESIQTSYSSLIRRNSATVNFAQALSAPEQNRDLIGTWERVLVDALGEFGVSEEAAIVSVREAFAGYLAFAGNYRDVVDNWQNKMRLEEVADFEAVMAAPQAQADWQLIRKIIVEHDISPIVPPLVVDDQGKTVKHWRSRPAIFHLEMGLRSLFGR